MLGDVTPRQLRLVNSGVVYTARDNKFTVEVLRYDGRKHVPADLGAVTQFLLVVPTPAPVLVDSAVYPDVFSVSGGTLTIDLSDFAFAPGVYSAQLIAIDAEHPRGQVLCETYENALQFTVRDVLSSGSTPLPVVEWVEEAPADGTLYARRDRLWIPVPASTGVSSFNGRQGEVLLLSDDVVSALGFIPVMASDLAAVAVSGSYIDLMNTPTIPASPGDVGAATAEQGEKADTAVQPQALADGLAGKVDKVPGKGLTDENYTAAEKAKLAGLEGSHYRGTYVNFDALQTAVPDGVPGDYADVDAGAGSPVLRYIWDDNDGVWVAQAGSAEPITAAQVKALYESNADTNAYSDAEKDKLEGVAAGATANDNTDSLPEGATNLWFTAARVRNTVLTGLSLMAGPVISAADTVLTALGKLQAQITALTSAVGGKVDKVSGKQLSTEDYTTVEKNKLGNIATGATANATNAQLRDRSTHTGTQPANTIADLTEVTQDTVAAMLEAGANVSLTYDDTTGKLTIAAASSAAPSWAPVVNLYDSTTVGVVRAGAYCLCNAELTITVEAQATETWQENTEMHFEQSGSGAVSFAGAAGVTLQWAEGYNARTVGQFAVVTLKRTAENKWTLFGALEPTS